MRKLKRYTIMTFLLGLLILSGCELNKETADNMKDVAEDLIKNSSHSLSGSKKAIKKLVDGYIEEYMPDKGELPNTPSKQTESNTPVPHNLAEYIVLNMPKLPEYKGMIYEVVNENEPFFTETDLSTVSFEYYSDLDEKGRCGACVANIGIDLMPTEERGPIGNVKPSGWIQNKYPGLVEGNYLYNRCHLIGYQLTGENANENNLITGTRQINTEGMLPFENMVADYIRETNNHVLYRVTPVFEGDNLLATGVLMEAKSVEDNGAGITFCVFVFNIQNGIQIDYTDGSNWLEE